MAWTTHSASYTSVAAGNIRDPVILRPRHTQLTLAREEFADNRYSTAGMQPGIMDYTSQAPRAFGDSGAKPFSYNHPPVSWAHSHIWPALVTCLAALPVLLTSHLLITSQRRSLSVATTTVTSGTGPRPGEHRLLRILHRGGLALLGIALWGASPAFAMSLDSILIASDTSPTVNSPITYRILLWFALFLIASAFHSAETAITTLWPWKVKEFAEDEGEGSPFQYLVKDITRVLTTILVASTICTVYGTAIITTVISHFYTTPRDITLATVALTAFTLFFQELMPKALGVSNAELVARKMVPIIALLSIFLNPIGLVFGWASRRLLQLLGLRYTDAGIVTDKELRFLLEGARVSGGVETEEAEMIEGVLDLQDTKVSQVMTPRVDLVAIEKNKNLLDLLELIESSKYSRIPVYDTDVDNVVGVVMARSILNYAILHKNMKANAAATADTHSSSMNGRQTMDGSIPTDAYVVDADAPSASNSSALVPTVLEPSHPQPEQFIEAFMDLSKVTVEEEMEATYFVPETMTVSNVLAEMRRRRLHMAVVVDEYGGTSGVVTLEDLLEEIVGEIYDEVDIDDEERTNQLIRLIPRLPEDQQIQYLIRGEAALSDVADTLGIELDPEASDFVTVSGYLCAKAGAIPQVGDLIAVPPYIFNVRDCDERRIKELIAARPIDRPADTEIRDADIPAPLH